MWEAPTTLYPDIPRLRDDDASGPQAGALRSVGIGARPWSADQAEVLLSARSYAEAIMEGQDITMHWKECRLRLMLFVLADAPSHQWLIDWSWIALSRRGDEEPIMTPQDDLAGASAYIFGRSSKTFHHRHESERR